LDAIDLGASDAASDTVIMTTGGAIAIDTVANFLVGATTPDNINVDLSDLNALIGTMRLAGSGTSALAADATPTVTAVSAAFDQGTVATTDIYSLSHSTAFTTDTLETALEASGNLAITFNGAWASGDAFLVIYDNGTHSWLAMVTTGALADNATAVSGTLTVTNLIQLTGVSNAALFLTNNIDIVA